MRDSILFSALPMPSNGPTEDWTRLMIEEFSCLMRAHVPFFLLAPSTHTKLDNVDLGDVDASCALFLPKADVIRKYATTLAGKEQRIKAKSILSGGGASEYEEVSFVCRNGFESIFIPSKERASNFSRERKTSVVTWENGHFVDCFFDTRTVIERTLSAIILLESATPELREAINDCDFKVFIEELRYIQRTKLKKGCRRYDLAEGIFTSLACIKNYEALFYAAIDVRCLIKSLLGDDQWGTVLSLFRPHTDCVETPFFYFNDYNTLDVCCRIMRQYTETVYFYGEDFGPKQLLHVDAAPDTRTRDSARSLSKQARLAMWYAELSKNNGAGVFCNMCGKKLDFNDFAVDHVFPWSKGGKTEPSNLQILCKTCNQKKGARVDMEGHKK